MKRSLNRKETVFVASMLFGMFFGAGNLIFPVSMGQLSGNNMWQAATGFLITGVGLPLLGVVALGISREDGLMGLSSRVGRRYGKFFTCILYLTIGPFFAIPRCATVAYTVGVERIIPDSMQTAVLAVFSLLFFAAVLFFSLRPGEILTWIGKVLNPLFLLFLGLLVIRALLSPMGSISGAAPEGAYAAGAFYQGFLEGYNTMDALAGLAFGIIVVNVIRDLGVENPGDAAKNTVRSGILSSVLMAVIYVLVTVVGAQSRGVFPPSSNGGEALALIAGHYFGPAGAVILAAAVFIFISNAPIPFVNKIQQVSTSVDEKLLDGKTIDPNKKLYASGQGSEQTESQVASVTAGNNDATEVIATDRYWVTAGTFSELPDAEKVRGQIAFTGNDAQIEYRREAGKRVYRVRLGPFDNETAAEEIRQTLADNGIQGTVMHQPN